MTYDHFSTAWSAIAQGFVTTSSTVHAISTPKLSSIVRPSTAKLNWNVADVARANEAVRAE